jgi:N-acetylmuramic acid 6-phosphate etherase
MAGMSSGVPATEAVSARYSGLEGWDLPGLLAGFWEGQLAAVAAVGPALPALGHAIGAAADRLGRGGRLAYAGAGTSGRIGMQDGVELLPTFGWPEERLLVLIAGGAGALLRSVEGAEDGADAGAALAVEHGFGPEDVVVALAASGTSPFTVAVLRQAKRSGSLTIGIANSAGTRLLQEAEHPVLLDTGEEVIAGSTRMKAGTAQKVALNLFSTALMVRLGHVYRGQMVGMQIRSAKLRQRAERIVHELGSCTPAEARKILRQAGGNIRLALLAAHGLTAGEAEALLAHHRGNLNAALAARNARPARAGT